MTSGTQGTFGQRGVTAGASAARTPAVELQTDVDEPEEREPGLLASLFGIGSGEDDEFDVRLSEEYAPGKTLWITIPLWLFFGSFGLHRFYLGHIKMGFLILGVLIFMSILLFSTATTIVASTMTGQQLDKDAVEAAFYPLAIFGWWVFGDGIYVIVRKLRPM